MVILRYLRVFRGNPILRNFPNRLNIYPHFNAFKYSWLDRQRRRTKQQPKICIEWPELSHTLEGPSLWGMERLRDPDKWDDTESKVLKGSRGAISKFRKLTPSHLCWLTNYPVLSVHTYKTRLFVGWSRQTTTPDGWRDVLLTISYFGSRFLKKFSPDKNSIEFAHFLTPIWLVDVSGFAYFIHLLQLWYMAS